MDKSQKREFIMQLVGMVQDEILSNVDRMPEEWNGVELRKYIADKYVQSVMCSDQLRANTARGRAYANVLIVKNL